ncbi:unnamed protein product, partial [Ectocarpus sp. 12 AP-2014]
SCSVRWEARARTRSPWCKTPLRCSCALGRAFPSPTGFLPSSRRLQRRLRERGTRPFSPAALFPPKAALVTPTTATATATTGPTTPLQ